MSALTVVLPRAVALVALALATAAPAQSRPAISTSVKLPEPGRKGSFSRMTPQQMVDRMIEAAPDRPIAAPARPRKLLVFTLSIGYMHPIIPHVAACLDVMGQKTGAWETTVTDDPSVFEAERLSAFDAVVMDNTVNQFVLLTTDELARLRAKDKAVAEMFQRRNGNLCRFVREGKGLAGFHGATDCGGEWPEYPRMIGGRFVRHPWNTKVVCRVESADNAINRAASGGRDRLEFTDEIYIFSDPYSRATHRVLLSLDMEKCGTGVDDPTWAAERGRDDGDNAMLWIKRHGEGRVFYSALGGHNPELCWNPEMLRYWLAGVQYALGDLKADDSPSGVGSAPPLPSEAQLRRIREAAPAQPHAAPAGRRSVLVLVPAGRPDVAKFAAAAIEEIGKKTGAFQATVSEDPEAVAPARLAAFDAVCLVNTSAGLPGLEAAKRGDKVATARKSLIEFVKGGKGLVAIHSAAAAARDWPELGQMLGATFVSTPWKKGTVRVESPENPINAAYRGRETFEFSGLVPMMPMMGEPYSRQGLRVLLSLHLEKSGILDPKMVTSPHAGRSDGDNALSWVRSFGEGRVYYSAFGGASLSVYDAAVLSHWLAGIQYAVGDLKADATPGPACPEKPLPPASQPATKK